MKPDVIHLGRVTLLPGAQWTFEPPHNLLPFRAFSIRFDVDPSDAYVVIESWTEAGEEQRNWDPKFPPPLQAFDGVALGAVFDGFVVTPRRLVTARVCNRGKENVIVTARLHGITMA